MMANEAKSNAVARPLKMTTSRGVQLEGDLHVPTQMNGTAVVIAPGEGYHRGLPLLTKSAEWLTDLGFLSLRFDWGYFTAGGHVSQDSAPEMDDLETALQYAQDQEGVRRALIIGKSLGSMKAIARAAQKSDDLAGIALLTFPIHHPGATERLFFDATTLNQIKAPILIICGDRDPMCELGSLYRLLGSMVRSPSVVVVPGDHNLRITDDDAARTAENIGLAVRALALWSERFTAGPGNGEDGKE